jgi:hypothetical protein
LKPSLCSGGLFVERLMKLANEFECF